MLLSLLAMVAGAPAAAKPHFPFELPPKVIRDPGPIAEVVIGPVFRRPFTCTEHPEGQLEYAGDALGTDCLVIGGVESPTRGFMKTYRSDGAANSDWYGWNEDVLAPFDGVVDMIYANPVENVPGQTGKPPASMIRFRRADGLIVVYAHAKDFTVRAGDRVKQGQVVAKVGNNGFARNPHIHIGAYRGATPFQIRWDLRLMGRMGIGQE
jgi:hypothetical protein